MYERSSWVQFSGRCPKKTGLPFCRSWYSEVPVRGGHHETSGGGGEILSIIRSKPNIHIQVGVVSKIETQLFIYYYTFLFILDVHQITGELQEVQDVIHVIVILLVVCQTLVMSLMVYVNARKDMEVGNVMNVRKTTGAIPM